MFLPLLVSASIIALTIFVMGLFGSKTNFEVDNRVVIVTGGSQGLGLSIAKLLASKGANVVIIAQTISKLERAIEQIQKTAKSRQQRFKYLSYDLRSSESAPAIISEVEKWNNNKPPDIVFNCAGHCVPSFFATSKIETLRDQMDTIYWSCAYMAHATLKSWTTPTSKDDQSRYKSPRHLIFTASVVAFLPLAGYAPYSPAKAAMRSLADTLNQEVRVYNGTRSHPSEPGPAADIKIHTIYPTGIQSPGFDNEQKLKPALTQKLEEDDKPQDPDELAKVIVKELETGRYMITGSFIGHVMKGWSFGGSQRVGFMDYLWNWLGSLIVLFIVPDFFSKCQRWGREKGMQGVR